MHKLIGFNIKRNKKLLVSDIIKFFEVRGYELTDAHAGGMTFKRGSYLGNMTSLTPENWNTKVDLEIIKKERLDYNIYANYHFSTSGFFRSKIEDKYYDEEINAFSKAIENFEVDSEYIEGLAVKTNKSYFNHMLKSLIFGIPTAFILVFAINLLMNESLPIVAAFCISIFSILSYYFLFSKFSSLQQ